MGQGKSGRSQGILKWVFCMNPESSVGYSSDGNFTRNARDICLLYDFENYPFNP